LLSIAAARREGLRLMVGCMLGTSLAMAPALLLASHAEHIGPRRPADARQGSDRRAALRREHRAPAGRRLLGVVRMIIDIPRPYLLFLGDVKDELSAKTAFGIRDWCREDCVGQLRLLPLGVDLGLEDLTQAEARARGARTMVIGVANSGGYIAESWLSPLLAAVRSRARHRGRSAPASRRHRAPRGRSAARGCRVARCPPAPKLISRRHRPQEGR
jgi:hypothetical protein